MKLPELLPPADLLKQIEGVESGLRRRKSLGNVGAAGALVVAALQVTVTLANSKWWRDLSQFKFSQLARDWPYLLGFAAFAFFVLLYTWSRFWLKGSREAFRYTCSIAEFEPVRYNSGEDPPWLTPALRERLSCLSHDLAERFSQRVGRIRFRDKPAETKPGEGVPNQSHIHIRGMYVLRQDRDHHWALEIMPRVRIGPSEASEALAHPVAYRLEQTSIDRDHYERIQERLYFSVATELYRQIREDVAGKIDLLPTSHFRALAYFYEAEDYSRSNTLDAYKEASKLYGKAIELFDPRLKPLPETRLLKFFEKTRREVFSARARMAGSSSLLRPRAARTQLMCARAEIGYANMLLYRRILAGLSGERLNPIFEARPIVLDAVRRLESLHPDVPGRRESLFDAYVTVSLAQGSLGDVQGPAEWLEKAHQLDPCRSDEDPRYLFVSGRNQSHLNSRMNLLRRATELEPRFEVAQWSLAITRETMWRTRPTLESNVAEIVLRDYEEVLKINPGNVSAWANRGYIRWLLCDPKAKEEFENGLEYKAMRPQTFISELDYGLARIAAEQGDMLAAYRHYVDAVSALLAEGVFHGAEDSTYYFNQIGREMLDRIGRYRQSVRTAICAGSDAAPTRVKKSVYAYALNDYGEACYTYFLRRGDARWLTRARALFRLAARLNPQYAIPSFQLANADRLKSQLENRDQEKGRLFSEALKRITRATELEPDWADGTLKQTSIYVAWARHVREREQAAQARIAGIEAEAARLREDAARKSADAAEKKEQARRQFSAARPAEVPQPAIAPAPALPAGATPVDIRAQDVPIEARPPEPLEPPGAGVLPQPRVDPDLEIEARALEKRAVTLTASAKAKQGEADELRQHEEQQKELEEKRFQEFARAVQDTERLLPHTWLRAPSPPGANGGSAFNWPALTNQEYVREWKWERELNDLHAKALRARALSERVQRNGATGDLQRKLIACLREHFFPGDFDLMEAGRDSAAIAKPGAPAGYTAEMRAVVINWFSEYPADYWALTWVIDPAFSEGGLYDELARDTLTNALEQQNVSAHTCFWVGEMCERNMPAIARRAYQQVVRISQDHALLARAGDRLESLARADENLKHLDKWDDAREAYQKATDVVEAPPAAPAAKPDRAANRARRAADDYRISLGRLHWYQNRFSEAIRQFDQVRRDTPWIDDLVGEILSSPDVGGSHRQIRSWLERKAMACRRNGGERARRDVNEAILRFADRSVEEYDQQAGAKAAAMLPILTPLAVEAEATLYPEGEDWTKTHPLFTEYVPQMRQRIQADMGVTIPGIRFRAETTELPVDSYRILLHEVPLASGSVVRNCRFCADESALQQAAGRSISGRAGFNPRTPWRDGIWLSAGDWTAAEKAGLPLWNEFQYILAHTEYILRANLAQFLGLQEVENSLETWHNQARRDAFPLHAPPAADVLPDIPCRLRFMRLLQALVTENVPVKDLDSILDAVRCTPTGPGADLLPWVEAVRLKLRDRLPGNNVQSEFFWLSPRFEEQIFQGIARLDGSGDPLRTRTLFSLLPETAQDLFKAVRATLGQSERHEVIVTRTEGIRPFVRRLIQLEFPYVQTLSLAELRPNLRDKVRRTIDL
ncbi:MAG TPA: FHIPEP family type III secretion protein [Verrucomicrobiae bacterium]|nr:FHIPEP family type III secretion protein [Verrucomicrobiae bacterium]